MLRILLAPVIGWRATLSLKLVQSERKLGILLKGGGRKGFYLLLVMKKEAWDPRTSGNHFITRREFNLGMELMY